ncbi:RraA family protein [Hydrogenoanaerobacterium sp.]|uniref:RraA family protein n=1 Tax=Hydrogenoanaerobacterium sp. TaxID=2953763 RepID=UPI0028A07F41|nr:RraA family protein [Hydrogenoanaerobacterium sp.]
MNINNREEILAITSHWKGERFPDGRPRVSDEKLEMIRTMTIEEIWLPLYVKGYRFQFEGDLKILHHRKKLVGRAVTCTFMPTRPDLKDVVYSYAKENGWEGMGNQWVVDSLTEGDVLVADMYDKVFNGTFVGGNLTTAIATHTKNGGAIIWGGVRDVEQMEKIKDAQVYYRGSDPTPIRACVMTDFNGPCRIGKAVCLPGDVVLGTGSGVMFIPCHEVDYVINSAQKSHAKDIFGFEMIANQKYTTAEIDNSLWRLEMLEDLEKFLQADPRCEKYRNLDWSLEWDAAKGDPQALEQVMKTCLQ